jgi:hypothetical protein
MYPGVFDRVVIKVSHDKNHPRGGWKYLTTVRLAEMLGIYDGRVLEIKDGEAVLDITEPIQPTDRFSASLTCGSCHHLRSRHWGDGCGLCQEDLYGGKVCDCIAMNLKESWVMLPEPKMDEAVEGPPTWAGPDLSETNILDSEADSRANEHGL